RKTTNSYDAAGRITQTTFADGTFTEHQYDEAGNCIAITDELGRVTRFVYDNRNRLAQTIYPDGSSTQSRSAGAGQLVATVAGPGAEKKFKYDKAGRLVDPSHALTFNNETGVPIVETNTYDNLSRLISEVDANGGKTSYAYDAL